jgi:hypothetical protein
MAALLAGLARMAQEVEKQECNNCKTKYLTTASRTGSMIEVLVQ